MQMTMTENQTADDPAMDYETDTKTIRHLCAAMDALREANDATKCGEVSDRIIAAVEEVGRAMRSAIRD